MNKIKAPSPLSAADYEAIEDALLQNARGRWFLSEYAQRNRTADTQMLLDAITKLEMAVMPPHKPAESVHLRNDLIEMAEAISQTRSEIASMRSPDEKDCQFTTATEELDAIVEATEKATSDILEAAEDVQEAAWVMREKGAEEEICDRLDARATDIYTACSFQDVTGQRIGKVVQTLRFLENRVLAMIEIWGLEDIDVQKRAAGDERPDAHLLNGPARRGEEVNQANIDQLLDTAPANAPVIEGETVQQSQAPEAVPASEKRPQPDASPDENADSRSEAVAAEPQTPVVAMASQIEELPGEVDAKAFSAPAGLDIDELDETKTQALFV